jgi:Flp pilus assembly protein TadG
MANLASNQFGTDIAMPDVEFRKGNMHKLRKLLDEQGSALILVALGFSVLLGFTALAVDMGQMFHAKRNMQIAADAAAVAGSLDYLYNGSVTSAKAAAKSASSSNFYTDGTNSVTVTPNMGPTVGAYAGNTNFFEVIVSQPVPTLFMATVGKKTMTIEARAVAGTPVPGDVCIWVMNPTGADMNVQGSYDIETPKCGIYVNSPASSSFSTTGNGGTINALFLDVVGNSPPSHQTTPTPATINTAPRTNPWGNLTGPTPANGGCSTSNTDATTTSLTGTLGTVTVTGPGAGNAKCYSNTAGVTLKDVTFGPGVYVFENGVKLQGTDTIQGPGTLDIYSGAFSQVNNAVLNITAPTSGTYNAIALMQPATNTKALSIQMGSSNSTMIGYIYAPGANVNMQDNGTGACSPNATTTRGTESTGIVAGTFSVGPSQLCINSYDLAHPTTTPNRVVTLIE